MKESVKPDCSSEPSVARTWSSPASISAESESDVRSQQAVDKIKRENSHTMLFRGHIITTIGKSAIVTLFWRRFESGATLGEIRKTTYRLDLDS